jgi:hypothetical protein
LLFQWCDGEALRLTEFEQLPNSMLGVQVVSCMASTV